MNLHNLTEKYQDLLDLAADGGDREQLDAMLDGLGGKIEEKIGNTACVVRSLELQGDVLDAEIKRLQARRSSMLNNATYLKECMQTSMTVMELDKVKTPLFTIGIQNNPPKVVVVDEFAIPESYFKVPQPTRSLMKEEVAKAWKAGQAVPGTEIVQEKSIRIK